jgi:hypothetical protein
MHKLHKIDESMVDDAYRLMVATMVAKHRSDEKFAELVAIYDEALAFDSARGGCEAQDMYVVMMINMMVDEARKRGLVAGVD